MRNGFNPQKNKKTNVTHFFHQVVIPVYVPNQEGYFTDGFTILKICLESLFKTKHSKTFITIVNNGSCREVEEYLTRLFERGKIHELIHTNNIGYINAMLKGITGHNFPYFTNADADVLFLNGWQEESYKLFEAFPKLGAVSPVPNPKMIKYYTGNIFFEQGFSSSLKFAATEDPEAMSAFARSINKEKLFKNVHLNKCLTINKGNTKGVVGAGHFIVTYKSEIFNNLENRYTDFVLGGNSDFLFDEPVFKKGYWRLATKGNYAFHMGNIAEDWMGNTLRNLYDEKNNPEEPILPEHQIIRGINWFTKEIFSRLIFKKPLWFLFLKYKGLTKQEAENY